MRITKIVLFLLLGMCSVLVLPAQYEELPLKQKGAPDNVIGKPTQGSQSGQSPLPPRGQYEPFSSPLRPGGGQSGQYQMPPTASQYQNSPPRPGGGQSGQYQMPPPASQLYHGAARQYAPPPPQLSQLPNGQSSQYFKPPAPANVGLGTGVPGGKFSQYQLPPAPQQNPYQALPMKPAWAPDNVIKSGASAGQALQSYQPPANQYQTLPLRPKTKWEKAKSLPGKVKAKASYLPKKVKKAFKKPAKTQTKKKVRRK